MLPVSQKAFQQNNFPKISANNNVASLQNKLTPNNGQVHLLKCKKMAKKSALKTITINNSSFF
jgi:hypothetical protein